MWPLKCLFISKGIRARAFVGRFCMFFFLIFITKSFFLICWIDSYFLVICLLLGIFLSFCCPNWRMCQCPHHHFYNLSLWFLSLVGLACWPIQKLILFVWSIFLFSVSLNSTLVYLLKILLFFFFFWCLKVLYLDFRPEILLFAFHEFWHLVAPFPFHSLQSISVWEVYPMLVYWCILRFHTSDLSWFKLWGSKTSLYCFSLFKCPEDCLVAQQVALFWRAVPVDLRRECLLLMSLGVSRDLQMPLGCWFMFHLVSELFSQALL